MNTMEKIGQLYQQIDNLSAFEQTFVQTNVERIEKFGDATKFTPKQITLADRIYKDRIEDGKLPKAKAEALVAVDEI